MGSYAAHIMNQADDFKAEIKRQRAKIERLRAALSLGKTFLHEQTEANGTAFELALADLGLEQ